MRINEAKVKILPKFIFPTERLAQIVSSMLKVQVATIAFHQFKHERKTVTYCLHSNYMLHTALQPRHNLYSDSIKQQVK